MWQAEEKASTHWSFERQHCLWKNRAKSVLDREGNELSFFHIISIVASSSKGIPSFLLQQSHKASKISLDIAIW